MKILCLILLTFLSIEQLNAQDVHVVLQKYLEAVGGSDKISSINSYYQHEVFSSPSVDTSHSKLKQRVTYYKLPYTRYESYYDGNKVTVAFLFPRGYKMPYLSEKEVFKIRDKKSVKGKMMLDLLNHLGGARYIVKAIEEKTISFSDTVEIEGKLYYKFTVNLQDPLNFYFNANTYLLERYDSDSNSDWYAVYSDFENVDGLVVPTIMTRNKTNNDVAYEKYELAMLDINTFIPDTYFPKKYLK